jgi:hypothetical protein
MLRNIRMTAVIFVIVVAVWPASGIVPARPLPPSSRTYVILIDASRAGLEKVTEDTDEHGNVIFSSEHEMFISDGMEVKRLAFTTTMILSKADHVPLRYSCKYTSGETQDSYDLTVDNGEIKRNLTRAGHSSEATGIMKPGTVIADFNVYYQYALLTRPYDSKTGGRQVFQDYIPLIGNEIPVALTQLEPSTLSSAKLSIPVRNFSLEFVGILTGTLSIDAEGRLVRLSVPRQHLQVVRQDLLPE